MPARFAKRLTIIQKAMREMACRFKPGEAAGQLILAGIEVMLQPADGHFAHRHNALFIPFADAADEADLEVDVAARQMHQLADAQAGGIEHLQHCAVAQPARRTHFRRSEQALHLLQRQRGWQPFHQARHLYIGGGIRCEDTFGTPASDKIAAAW